MPIKSVSNETKKLRDLLVVDVSGEEITVVLYNHQAENFSAVGQIVLLRNVKVKKYINISI